MARDKFTRERLYSSVSVKPPVHGTVGSFDAYFGFDLKGTPSANRILSKRLSIIAHKLGMTYLVADLHSCYLKSIITLLATQEKCVATEENVFGNEDIQAMCRGSEGKYNYVHVTSGSRDSVTNESGYIVRNSNGTKYSPMSSDFGLPPQGQLAVEILLQKGKTVADQILEIEQKYEESEKRKRKPDESHTTRSAGRKCFSVFSPKLSTTLACAVLRIYTDSNKWKASIENSTNRPVDCLWPGTASRSGLPQTSTGTNRNVSIHSLLNPLEPNPSTSSVPIHTLLNP